MSTSVKLAIVCLIAATCLAGCGGGGGENGNLGFRIGERDGNAVYMNPGPPPHIFEPWSGVNPDIRVEEVTQFSSIAHPDGTGIYEPTTQVAYGRITGETSGKRVVIYSYTNGFYIQPLTRTTIDIRSNSTWIAPANPGVVSALLIRDGYYPPDITVILPAVDGVNVFAIASQP